MGELPRAAMGEAYGKQHRTKKPAEAGHVVEQANERTFACYATTVASVGNWTISRIRPFIWMHEPWLVF
jgi:hypothetical protein